MKKFLFLLAFMPLVLGGCEDKGSVEYIKGHTFISDRGKSMVELAFKRDMSVVYTWKNTWEKDKNHRQDLYYQLDTDTEFTIFTTSNDSVWCLGKYYPASKPYIIVDNFPLDTLYVK